MWEWCTALRARRGGRTPFGMGDCASIRLPNGTRCTVLHRFPRRTRRMTFLHWGRPRHPRPNGASHMGRHACTLGVVLRVSNGQSSQLVHHHRVIVPRGGNGAPFAPMLSG